jgi:hypothetical protein
VHLAHRVTTATQIDGDDRTLSGDDHRMAEYFSRAGRLGRMAAQRIVILSGHLSETELAAVTAALEQHTAGRNHPRRPASRWSAAARLEARGHPPIGDPTNLPR